MSRCCSHCSHNSKTCPNCGVKLVRVRLTDGLIRKGANMLGQIPVRITQMDQVRLGRDMIMPTVMPLRILF
ncbi:hypothetical protein SLEP1_g9119 [Rubroshorea leprosula]|uniref:Uncharacterized protein n=1 Tax=Rubroshorea leprosula TaxID=152421 RepID=A0AAV5I9X1_9ROSI|nr:hypothetical protein SLEP1_g9119 [Rubroshorea leprosula]